MSEADLEGILDDLKAELPANVRKTLKAAIDNGWELHKPGMTIAIRFDHPTLDDAPPVYLSWAIGRTPKGSMSWRFQFCGTKSLIPLSGAELLEYLADPTLVLPSDEPGSCDFHLCDAKEVFQWKAGGEYCAKHAKTALPAIELAKGHYGEASDYNAEDAPPWDTDQSVTENLKAQLGATPTLFMGVSPAPSPKVSQPLRVSAPALRVTAPSPQSS